MPTRGWAASALALLLAGGTALASGGAAVTAATAGAGKTRLTLTDGAGHAAQVVVSRDARVPPQAAPRPPQRLGDVDGGAVLLLDRYPSKLSGGGACGAGEEVFLRVVRLAPARQTFALKLASCWDELELQSEFGSGGLSWQPQTRELQIEWLSGPGGGPEKRRLRIDREGRVETVKPA
jgi:hypothetical protein